MPITPSQLAHRRARVDFTFAGEPMHIEYYPAALADTSVKELNALSARATTLQQDPNASEEEVNAALLAFGAWAARVLAAWDYLEDADADAPDGAPGAMVPITPERMAEETNRFPDFVQACLLAAFGHYRESKTSGAVSSAPSGATSSPMAPSTSSAVAAPAKRSRKPSR